MLHEYCLWCFLLGHSEESHNPHNYLKHSRSRQVVKFLESQKIEVRIFLSGSQNQADPTILIKMGSAVFSSGKILHKMYHVSCIRCIKLLYAPHQEALPCPRQITSQAVTSCLCARQQLQCLFSREQDSQGTLERGRKHLTFKNYSPFETVKKVGRVRHFVFKVALW